MPVDGHLRAPRALLVAALPELLRHWDGTTERVAFLMERSDAQTLGGFWERSRAETALQNVRNKLKGVAPLREGFASDVVEVLAALRRGPTEHVQCLVLGEETCVLFELDPMHLRAITEVGRSVAGEDLSGVLADCGSAEGIARLVRSARLSLRARGQGARTLKRLEEDVLAHWGDPLAVLLAFSNALEEMSAYPRQEESRRARALLELLASVFATRPAKCSIGAGAARK